MDTKISSEFWEDEKTAELGIEEKLAALWLMTNSRLKVCGYVEISERVFRFHTGLTTEALRRTIEALPKTFIEVGKGIWIRNFIRRQIGAGNSLATNNWTKKVCQEIEALGMDDLRLLVAQEYPEIRHLLFSPVPSKKEGLAKGLPSPREEKRREEKREEGVGETGILGNLGPSSQTEFATEGPIFEKKESPAGVDEMDGHGRDGQKKGAADVLPIQTQRRRFGAIFGRPVGAAWAYEEERTLSEIQPVATGDLKLVEWRYRQPEEEGDPRRKRLLTLLQNLPGEIDAARAQFKRQNGGLDGDEKKAGRKEPIGWREILEQKYRRPEDTTWTPGPSFWALPASVRAEILRECNGHGDGEEKQTN